MKDIRIAAVVCRSPFGQVSENIKRTEYYTRKAREQGASIICFPEMNITGYATQRKLIDYADTIPGHISDRLGKLSAASGLVILAGIAEKHPSGRLFASHLVASPDHRVAVYRKVHPAPPERDVFSPADTIPVFNASGVTFGIQLCYDAHFPELSTCMAEAGAEVIFFPHASPRGSCTQKLNSWTRHLPARAFDNSLYVVACNQSGTNDNGLEFPGLALAIGPSGEIIGKKTDDEGLLIVDLKAKDLDHVRNHKMRYFLPNRRPEIYAKKPS